MSWGGEFQEIFHGLFMIVVVLFVGVNYCFCSFLFGMDSYLNFMGVLKILTMYITICIRMLFVFVSILQHQSRDSGDFKRGSR